MAKVVNLRQAKKDAARKAARSRADANSVKFGRTKAERALDMARTQKAASNLDGHRRETE